MANEFLCAIATFDRESEKRIDAIRHSLIAAGLVGKQTPNIPHHITLGYYPLERIEEVAALVQAVAGSTERFSLPFSSLGLFGLNVMFLAPDVNYELLDLHERLKRHSIRDERGWTAHATILIDEPKNILRSLPIVTGEFDPFTVSVESISLFQFFPARLVGVYPLR